MAFKDLETQRKYMREWRARNKDKMKDYYKKWSSSERGKQRLAEREQRLRGTPQAKARQMIKNRLNKKLMPHASVFLCTDCDNRAVHYHHEDYSIWWSVEPLCHDCHGKRHRID